jgi:hypothetical protein
MRDQVTTHNVPLIGLQHSIHVNKHARNHTTAGQELSLYATQVAKGYTGFYTAYTVIVKKGGSIILGSKVRTRNAESGE